MRRLAVALFLLVLASPFALSSPAFAAGANTGFGDGGSTAGDSRSSSITIPANTNLIVINAWRGKTAAGSTAAPSSVTVAGNAATAIAQTPTASQNDAWGKMYFYLSPPTGSQTIAVSGGGGEANNVTGFTWSAYSGMSQTGQPDSSGKLDNTTTTAGAVSTTVVGSKCWVIASFQNQGGTPTSYTNATTRGYFTPNTGTGMVDSNGVVATGAYTITINQANQEINAISASFCEASGARFAPWQFQEF